MTAVTANGAPVLHATIGMPLSGAWVARMAADADAVPSGAVTIEIEGGATLKGFARRSGDAFGRVEVLVVGGAGGLSKELDARYYTGAPAQTVLGDILRESGETLSSTADAGALGTYLQKWTRTRARAGRQVAELLGPLDVSWRVLDDGSIWVGSDTWPAASLDYDIVAKSPGEDRWVIAEETLGLRPGVTLDGRRVSYVAHSITPEAIRTEVYLDAV